MNNDNKKVFLISRENLVKIPVEIDNLIYSLNNNLILAQKSGLDSFTWEIYKNITEDIEIDTEMNAKKDTDIIETGKDTFFNININIIEKIIKMLVDSGYEVDVFRSNILDYVKVQISWKMKQKSQDFNDAIKPSCGKTVIPNISDEIKSASSNNIEPEKLTAPERWKRRREERLNQVETIA
jgi:hypothetical protein